MWLWKETCLCCLPSAAAPRQADARAHAHARPCAGCLSPSTGPCPRSRHSQRPHGQRQTRSCVQTLTRVCEQPRTATHTRVPRAGAAGAEFPSPRQQPLDGSKSPALPPAPPAEAAGLAAAGRGAWGACRGQRGGSAPRGRTGPPGSRECPGARVSFMEPGEI